MGAALAAGRVRLGRGGQRGRRHRLDGDRVSAPRPQHAPKDAPRRVRGRTGGAHRPGEANGSGEAKGPGEARHAVLERLRHRDFPGVPASAPRARAWVRGLLAGEVAADTLDTALLLFSEVFTNALLHSDSGRGPDGSVTVYLGTAGGLAHVEVIDDGSPASVPFLRAAAPDSESGRGLALVDLLAARWGVHHDEETGTAVWFQVADLPETTWPEALGRSGHGPHPPVNTAES
ncbi:ATP-binding protein [Planomonospora corallina]|uniref:ATP-binding protein n=1 Tax=Planomonospora corallina TaxID=1806052 RepID=A0ABV8I9Y9_9ACTN